jgi:quinol monooxygenase YgiN
MQNAVAVFGILRFPPEKMAEIKPHLKVLVDATYQNDGCIAYDVAEDLFDLGLIRFSELWPDSIISKHHISSRGVLLLVHVGC